MCARAFGASWAAVLHLSHTRLNSVFLWFGLDVIGQTFSACTSYKLSGSAVPLSFVGWALWSLHFRICFGHPVWMAFQALVYVPMLTLSHVLVVHDFIQVLVV